MRLLPTLLLATLLALTSCEGETATGTAPPASGPENGKIQISVTDAPLDHGMVVHALIRVDKVRVHSTSSAESGFVTIYEGSGISFDLVNLRNGISRLLVAAELPEGDYRQIRLHVNSAQLELTNGNIYRTEDGSLKLTSQTTSGFKVFVDPPVHVSSELTADVLLDIDLSKTFKPTPANDPLNATTYKLHPVIRVANLTTGGELRGIVFIDDGMGGLQTVADATVYIMPPGETNEANAVASTASNSDGAYAVLGIEAGTYDVWVVRGAVSGRVNGVTVSAGNLSLVDVIIQ